MTTGYTYLISFSDFAPYAEISANISDKTINPYILQAQKADLQPLFGDIFWFEFINNILEQNYQDLINGKDYIIPSTTITARYSGLKPLLCYLSYARYVLHSNNHSTATGFVHKITQYSENLTASELQKISNEAKSTAIAYERELAQFLYYNKNDYPILNQIVGFSVPAFMNIETIFNKYSFFNNQNIFNGVGGRRSSRITAVD